MKKSAKTLMKIGLGSFAQSFGIGTTMLVTALVLKNKNKASVKALYAVVGTVAVAGQIYVNSKFNEKMTEEVINESLEEDYLDNPEDYED